MKLQDPHPSVIHFSKTTVLSTLIIVTLILISSALFYLYTNNQNLSPQENITIINTPQPASSSLPELLAQPSVLASASATTADLTKIEIAVLNGTKKSGLAQVVINNIQKDYKQIKNFQKGNTVGDYKSSQIIVQNNSYQQFANTLAKDFGAKITNLPAEEKDLKVDIIFLVGQDQI